MQEEDYILSAQNVAIVGSAGYFMSLVNPFDAVTALKRAAERSRFSDF